MTIVLKLTEDEANDLLVALAIGIENMESGLREIGFDEESVAKTMKDFYRTKKYIARQSDRYSDAQKIRKVKIHERQEREQTCPEE